MKKFIKAGTDTRFYSNQLISAMEDGLISAETVAREMIEYLSDDDVRDVCIALGLDDVITGASEPDATYVNKKNPNKFIETKKYKDGHQVARQYMKWDTPGGEVKNYTGAKDAKRGRYFRTRKDTLNEMLEDYDEVESATAISNKYGDRELVDIVPADTATGMYINIAETYPEYYENDGVAAHVFFDNGTANFWQDSEGTWRLGIWDENQYDENTYKYAGKFWCTEDLDAGDMNDIKLTPQQLYMELKSLPGVELDNLYGLREIFDDFSYEFSAWV